MIFTTKFSLSVVSYVKKNLMDCQKFYIPAAREGLLYKLYKAISFQQYSCS